MNYHFYDPNLTPSYNFREMSLAKWHLMSIIAHHLGIPPIIPASFQKNGLTL